MRKIALLLVALVMVCGTALAEGDTEVYEKDVAYDGEKMVNIEVDFALGDDVVGDLVVLSPRKTHLFQIVSRKQMVDIGLDLNQFPHCDIPRQEPKVIQLNLGGLEEAEIRTGGHRCGHGLGKRSLPECIREFSSHHGISIDRDALIVDLSDVIVESCLR